MSAINERVSDLIEKFTSDDMSALQRFVECCEDPDAGGHDVEKNIITRLSQYGALRQVRPGYHEVTEFGEFILNGGIDELQQYRAAAEPVLYCMEGDALDEENVSTSKAVVDAWVEEWNGEGRCPGEPQYRTVPLYRHAAPQVTSVPDERYRQLSDLYHAQEKRLFKLAQRIKGPAFDKYAYSPSQAIDVLESAIFGERDEGWNACRAAMLAAPAVQAEQPVVQLPVEFYSEHGIVVQLEKVMAALAIHGVKYERRGLAKGQLSGNSPVIPDGWIPVSERMPEEYGRYWCYVEEQNSLGKSHYQWNCSWNGDVWSDPALTGRVTHWMPLPAAPKQEADNG